MRSIMSNPDILQLEVADAVMLRRIWEDAKGTAPPKTFTARLMRLALAWDAQVAVKGDETKNMRRAWSSIIRNRCAPKGRNSGGSSGLPTICEGTRLLKEWGGTTHEVLVTADGGAKWNGKNYSSLSVVARAMTGTNRNGPKFFCLREREKE